MGQRRQAVDLIELAIPVRGASTSKLDTLLDFYQQAGDRAGIERTYASYVSFQPDNPGMKLGYAGILYQAGKVAGAEGILIPMLAAGVMPEQVADVMIDTGGDRPPAACSSRSAPTPPRRSRPRWPGSRSKRAIRIWPCG